MITLHFSAFLRLLFSRRSTSAFIFLSFIYFFFARPNQSSFPAISEPAGEGGGGEPGPPGRKNAALNLHVFSALRLSADAAYHSVAPLQTILYECQLTQHCRPGRNKPGARQ